MSHCKQYLIETATLAGLVSHDLIEQLVGLLDQIRSSHGRVFVVGLGGSAANASHAVNDLRKLCNIEAYCPTDNVAEITAIANDNGWAEIFSGFLSNSQIQPRDALFVLSVGGGTDEVSLPLKQALDFAKSRGMTILGIVGRDGGYTKELGDCVVVVPIVKQTRITPHTEGFQSVILHCIVSHPTLQRSPTKW